MTTRTERLEAALRQAIEDLDGFTPAIARARIALAESGPSCCEETRERTRTECEDAAVEALVQTRDNERKAISKGGPSCSPNFRHIALVDNVATAIRALSNQAPTMSLDDSDYVHPGSGRLLSSRPVLGTPLKSQANGEEKKEGAPELPTISELLASLAKCVCGHSRERHDMSISPFGKCLEPKCACGPGCIHDGFVSADGKSAPPTTPPQANK